MRPKWEGKKGKGSATKRWKETKWHKDKIRGKTEWHKDKVTRKREWGKTECIKKYDPEIRKVRL